MRIIIFSIIINFLKIRSNVDEDNDSGIDLIFQEDQLPNSNSLEELKEYYMIFLQKYYFLMIAILLFVLSVIVFIGFLIDKN
ncbi:hypothetical protein HERIO_2655 [Hepatospora eriocheir]|uniref:Uncharacterized protein n=1 Tax=Hepatospora eriocheir TaxID=1081669 RepID=A0A1X0Q5F2_9MICR|nr:hypothetical protein HERIO_2655 [Hepatospora eriocheir]